MVQIAYKFLSKTHKDLIFVCRYSVHLSRHNDYSYSETIQELQQLIKTAGCNRRLVCIISLTHQSWISKYFLVWFCGFDFVTASLLHHVFDLQWFIFYVQELEEELKSIRDGEMKKRQEKLNSVRVVGVTCHSCTNPVLEGQNFKVWRLAVMDAPNLWRPTSSHDFDSLCEICGSQIVSSTWISICHIQLRLKHIKFCKTDVLELS